MKDHVLSRYNTINTYISLFITMVFIALFMGLTPLGYWRADEYGTGHQFREGGLNALTNRIITWSPRPLSEFILFSYLSVVDRLKVQGITVFLSCLWIVMISATFIPSQLALRSHRPTLCLLFFSILLLTISGAKNSEVLYWVQGAVAYIPTVSGLIFSFGLLVSTGLENRRSKYLLSLALAFAALSSETGAFVTGGFTSLIILYRILHRYKPLSAAPKLPIGISAILLPFICAIFVGYLLMKGRVGYQGEVFGDPSIAHSFSGAGLITLKTISARIYTFGDNFIDDNYLWTGLSVKILFALGSYFVCKKLQLSRETGVTLLLFGISCLAALSISSFGSYYQFGAHCCERHTTMEQTFVWLLVASTSAFISTITPPSKSNAYPVLISGCLLASCVIPIALLSGRVIGDYRNFSSIISSNKISWSTGLDKNDQVIFQKYAPGGIVQGGNNYLPSGTFNYNDPNLAWYNKYILDYFNKRSLVVKDIVENYLEEDIRK